MRTISENHQKTKALVVSHFAARACFHAVLPCVDEDGPVYETFNRRVDETLEEISNLPNGSIEVAAAKMIVAMYSDDEEEDDLQGLAGIAALEAFGLLKLRRRYRSLFEGRSKGDVIDEPSLTSAIEALSKEGKAGVAVATELWERVKPLLPLTVKD